MKHAIACLLAGGCLLSGCSSRPASSDVENTLKQLEMDWENAESKFDVNTVDRIMSDDWVGTEPDGTRHRKDEELADLRDHKGSLTWYAMDPISVRVFGDTAIVRAGGAQRGTAPDGEDASGIYVWTDVFIRQNGTWQVVASHTSKIE